MSIHKDNLPRPSAVEFQRAPKRVQTATEGSMFMTSTADPALLPTRLTLFWDNVRPQVVDAIWQHFSEHCHATFSITEPRTAEVLLVRWLSPPSISWSTPVAASVTGDLEVALAYE